MSALLVVGLLIAAAAVGGYFLVRSNPELTAQANEVGADVVETVNDTAELVEAVAEEAVEEVKTVARRRTKSTTTTPGA